MLNSKFFNLEYAASYTLQYIFQILGKIQIHMSSWFLTFD